jgi:hypothetical protein
MSQGFLLPVFVHESSFSEPIGAISNYFVETLRKIIRELMPYQQCPRYLRQFYGSAIDNDNQYQIVFTLN